MLLLCLFQYYLTATAGEPVQVLQVAIAGITQMIPVAVTMLTQLISKQMMTSFYQVTVCGESEAVLLVSMSPFVCTVQEA